MPISFEADAGTVREIRSMACEHLRWMAQCVMDSECRSCLHDIVVFLGDLLSTIHDLAGSGRILPSCKLTLGTQDPKAPAVDRTIRVGVYPLAANPMHWGHILVGLSAMALAGLDKVIYLIAGKDGRKPSMTSAEIRHVLGKSALERFFPIFEYSPIALGTDLDGETNFGRLLALNAHQKMEAFYIAGMDHCRRKTVAGTPDTLEKLERIVREQETAGNRIQTISSIFVERSGVSWQREDCETFLNVQLLPSLPYVFSSTAARRALCADGALCDAIVSLPNVCLLAERAQSPPTGGARGCFDG